MGCCYSYVDRKNQKKLNLLETLNKTIDNLRLLQNEESRQQNLLRNEKIDIEQEVVEQKLLASVKEKHAQTIETIKMFECKICMEKLNKVMLIPCGHCRLDCARNIQECPLCRSQVQGINNIYFN